MFHPLASHTSTRSRYTCNSHMPPFGLTVNVVRVAKRIPASTALTLWSGVEGTGLPHPQHLAMTPQHHAMTPNTGRNAWIPRIANDIITDDGDPIELVASSFFVIFDKNPSIPTTEAAVRMTRILYKRFTWCAVGPDVTAVHKRTRIPNFYAALHFAATIDDYVSSEY